MKKIVFGLAALAAIAFALPSIASAEDMKEGKMHHHKMHHDMRHHGWTHHHHHWNHHHWTKHHHHMKKEM